MNLYYSFFPCFHAVNLAAAFWERSGFPLLFASVPVLVTVAVTMPRPVLVPVTAAVPNHVAVLVTMHRPVLVPVTAAVPVHVAVATHRAPGADNQNDQSPARSMI